jgi:hypothetical protein
MDSSSSTMRTGIFGGGLHMVLEVGNDVLRGVFRWEREADDDGGAVVGSLAFGPDPAAVMSDYFATDGEPEAMGLALVTGGVTGMEGIEDGFELGGVETVSVIGEAELELVVLGDGFDGDLALGG